MSKVIRLPLVFYTDHLERDLPAPPEVKETKRHVWIDLSHKYLPELLSDARAYAEGGYDPAYNGLCLSAKATVKAIEAHLIMERHTGGYAPGALITMTYETDGGEVITETKLSAWEEVDEAEGVLNWRESWE